MKHLAKARTIAFLLNNPPLTEVANRLQQLLRTEQDEDLDIIYTGAICDSLTDGRIYEYEGSLIINDIFAFDNLIALYLHESNNVAWYVEPVEPYTFELLTRAQEPEKPIFVLTKENVPAHIAQTIDEFVFQPAIEDIEAPESRTRRELIDPVLERSGWSGELLERELYIPSTLDGRRSFVDYALYVKDAKNRESVLAAFFEAKHDGLPPDYGLEQAKLYAERAQANIRLVFASNGIEYVSFDRLTRQKSAALPMAQFPRPDQLAMMLSQGGKYTDPPFVLSKLSAPKSGLDPASEEDVRAVIELFYPDAKLRRLCLRFFADSIRHAYSFGPGKWQVTLAKSGHFIRLNVGKIEVCALFHNQIHLVLDDDTFSEQERYEAGRLSLLSEPSMYRSVPSSMFCDFIASTLPEIKPFVRLSYQSLIGKAATTVKKRTSFYIYHSPGVMAYLQREVDATLPTPIF
jgi:hypothetical protein